MVAKIWKNSRDIVWKEQTKSFQCGSREYPYNVVVSRGLVWDLGAILSTVNRDTVQQKIAIMSWYLEN